MPDTFTPFHGIKASGIALFLKLMTLPKINTLENGRFAHAWAAIVIFYTQGIMSFF